MKAQRLACEAHSKPWGRQAEALPWLAGLVDASAWAGQRVGELWFADRRRSAGDADLQAQGTGGAEDLLIKLLATSEPLSIQVHPDDAYAQQNHAWPCGKHEAWVVLEAEPQARIGLGLKQAISAAQLRQAALDGTLPGLLDWRPVRRGDVIDVPPGTIHAIGAGLTLLEVQQPVDATFRLYDFSRGRELHLDAACAVSRLQPYGQTFQRDEAPQEQAVVCDAGPFTLEAWRWVGARSLVPAADQAVWVIPIQGSCRIDGQTAEPLSVWRLQAPCTVEMRAPAHCVAAYAHPGRAGPLATPSRRPMVQPA